MRGRLTVAILSTAAAATLMVWPSVGFRAKPEASGVDSRVGPAVLRGVRYLQSVTLDGRSFDENGFDLVWCFCSIARTSSDPVLRELAWRFGHQQALRWRAGHRRVPAGAGTEELYQLVAGSHAAECLGVRDEGLRRELERAAATVTPEAMYGFDPRREGPPGDIPKACGKCGRHNPRGSRSCRVCGARLEMQDPYGIWCDAIIAAYSAEVYGVRFGASLADVLQWAPRMRPYPVPKPGEETVYTHAFYAVTHFVYAMNGYSLYQLRPEWFPQEFEFLRSNLGRAVVEKDAEAVGEFLDTLRSFGLTEDAPEMSAGVRFLLESQNSDGSWGDPTDADVYNRYHATWTAVDGLRGYRWHGERVEFPEAWRRLRASR
ncbi:MAG: hypothetical protein QM757_18245 [Paludibaculum sp.]